MLMSKGLPLPERIYVHDFFTIDGQKMSKSLGNTIPPKELIDIFGIDASRYLIASYFPNNGDVDIGMLRFKEKYNAQLANNLGNLVSRVCKLGQGIKINVEKNSLNLEFINLVNELKISEAIEWIFTKYIDESNNLLNKVEPWKLAENDKRRIEVLEKCAQYLLLAAEHLESVLPTLSQKIKNQFSGEIKVLENGLFPRIK